MNTFQFDLGGGASIALPVDKVVSQLVTQLQRPSLHSAVETLPALGQYVSGQGGVYAGDILGDDGTTYGLIVSEPTDVGRAKWGSEGERDLSTWDGLSNTNRLRRECPAARLASDYEADGHVDFYLPSRREMLVAMANVPHLFDKDSWYWTSSPYGTLTAWAVDFEYGTVYLWHRANEFRVRPFRRFTH